MTSIVRAALSLAALALAAQVWVHLDWIMGLSEHCDYPDGCVSTWLPFAFHTATGLWIVAVVLGALAWTILAVAGASSVALLRVGVAWVSAFASLPLTPVWLRKVHGELDVDAMGRGHWPPASYRLAVVLLVLAFGIYAYQVVAMRRPVKAATGAGAGPATPVVAVVLVLLAGAGFVVVDQVQRRSVATEVAATQQQKRTFLMRVKESLDGHPDQPRSQLVEDDVLVREGLRACRWLAEQPALDKAREEGDAERAYFDANPTVSGWPFAQGRSALRRDLLLDAWGQLCRDVYDDHISYGYARDD
jgi:hypothetical protein